MYLSRQSLARLLAKAKDGIDQRALDDDEYHRRHPKYQVEEYLKIVGKLGLRRQRRLRVEICPDGHRRQTAGNDQRQDAQSNERYRHTAIT